MNKWIFLTILLSSSPLLASDLGYLVTPKNTMNRIRQIGARQIVRELYEEGSGWSTMLSGIERGDEAWLDTALYLRSGTDAGSTSMLYESLGLGLERNPIGVLSRFSARELKFICIVDPVGDQSLSSKKKYNDLVERRKKILKAIEKKELHDKIKACLSEIE